MAQKEDLLRILSRIDGRGYKAYKDIEGRFDFAGFSLFIDYAQGDPFASPSKIRVELPHRVSRMPKSLSSNPVRKMALEDWLARQVRHAIRATVNGRRGSGKSGLIEIDAGKQEVLERTAVMVTPHTVEARLEVGLPASGRRVLGRQAEEMLCGEIGNILKHGLVWRNLRQRDAQYFVECVENQEYIRSQLDALGLVAFVADGSILPRESGASDRPLHRSEAVAFESPPSLRVTLDLPNRLYNGTHRITGMGIRKGVTLIVGGGYHGKSTLLKALERGVYPHVPRDGREYVVCCRDAAKIRAEDGRRVERVDISPFISNLPYGRSTTAFSSHDASGSTSQAANIIEALEVGATTLLLDEDTSATNFMMRDARMQALVAKKNEPITPFVDRVRDLYDKLGVSTVLVIGGSGDYFEMADTVIMMRDYLPYDVTAEAKKIAQRYPTQRRDETASPLKAPIARIPLGESFDASRGRRDVRISAKGLDLIVYGNEPIHLHRVEQLVDWSQTHAIGYAVHLAARRFMDGQATLREVLDAVEKFFDEEGIDQLDPFRRGDEHPGAFARPRPLEIAAAINRLRTVRMRQK
ncbi:MAG: ABC-ATPase domain-containing protein [Ardenticatenaceae bacterium]